MELSHPSAREAADRRQRLREWLRAEWIGERSTKGSAGSGGR
jgi:hypothetical protein